MFIPFVFRLLGRPEHTLYSNAHTILFELLYLILLGAFFVIYLIGDRTKPENLVKYYGNFIIGITLLIIIVTLIVTLVDLIVLFYEYYSTIKELLSTNKKVKPDDNTIEMADNFEQKMESPKLDNVKENDSKARGVGTTIRTKVMEKTP